MFSTNAYYASQTLDKKGKACSYTPLIDGVTLSSISLNHGYWETTFNPQCTHYWSVIGK